MIRLSGLVDLRAIGGAPVGSMRQIREEETLIQPSVPVRETIPTEQLVAIAEQGGKLARRARLALTLRKVKEEYKLSEEQIAKLDAIENKALDQVGKEDGDVDNDGDTDSSDKYLKHRRDVIDKKINEMLDEEDPEDPSNQGDYEGNMARAQLMSLTKSADKLFNMIGDDEGLEAWVQDKIGRAADAINTVHHYMDYEKNKNASAGDGMGVPADKNETKGNW